MSRNDILRLYKDYNTAVQNTEYRKQLWHVRDPTITLYPCRCDLGASTHIICVDKCL